MAIDRCSFDAVSVGTTCSSVPNSDQDVREPEGRQWTGTENIKAFFVWNPGLLSILLPNFLMGMYFGSELWSTSLYPGVLSDKIFASSPAFPYLRLRPKTTDELHKSIDFDT